MKVAPSTFITTRRRPAPKQHPLGLSIGSKVHATTLAPSRPTKFTFNVSTKKSQLSAPSPWTHTGHGLSRPAERCTRKTIHNASFSRQDIQATSAASRLVRTHHTQCRSGTPTWWPLDLDQCRVIWDSCERRECGLKS